MLRHNKLILKFTIIFSLLLISFFSFGITRWLDSSYYKSIDTIELDPKSSESFDPIFIDGNDDFNQTAFDNNWDGNGSYNNPYIIENYIIYATSDTHGIEIRNTDVYFIINNVSVLDGRSNYNIGFYFENITNGHITNSSAENNIAGFLLKDSVNNTFSNNIANYNFHGFRIWHSLNNTFINNTAKENIEYGFYLDNTDDDSCANNSLVGNIAENNYKDGFYLIKTTNNSLINNYANNNNYNDYNGLRI
ncbi:MAG: hypothetical protein EU547_07575, partial [Promethearchaeota archaeon]